MRWSLVLLALLSLGNASDALPLSATVSPRIAQAPASLHLKVIVERHADNRQVSWFVDGDRYYQAGERQMHGEAGERVFDLWWKNVPCGSYNLVVTLRRANGATYAARDTARVLGFDCPLTEDVQP